MPTPVSVARQCLTPEAARTLDEAVSVARRRSHSQTTSLHAVSALLSLPTSILRDACARARNSSYSPRLQFKALELCLSVSLDRVQSGQPAEPEPPVSNSLMAAIKRSQAHQRRLPENFRIYHEISQQQNTVSCVKVEIQQLILSILDDPVVSRVFAEAGFRSSEIKLAIIRPVPQVFRYRGPSLFLGDITDNTGRTRLGFRYPGFTGSIREEENNSYTDRRIGEVLAREKGRNPLLMGASAHDALRKFMERFERMKHVLLPEEISGLNAISIENDVSNQSNGRFDRDYVDLRFQEIGKLVDRSPAPGLLLNYGDLEVFVNENDSNGEYGVYHDRGGYVFATLTNFLRRYGKRVWLIGAVSSDEVYCRFLRRFSCAEQVWDLLVLTITSVRPCFDESYPKSSLMESFVPFGGFFTSSELKDPLTGSYKLSIPCFPGNRNSEEDLIATKSSAPDHCRSSLPLWLQTSKPPKIKDDVLFRAGTRFSTTAGFQAVENKKENDVTHCSANMIEGLDSGNHKSSLSGSTASVDSVTTDLGLGISSGSEMAEAVKHLDQNNEDLANTRNNQLTQLLCCAFSGQFDPEDYKGLLRALTEKVSWQEEAARAISCAVAQRRARLDRFGTRGDVWFNFVGPDGRGKRKIVRALVEILCGSRKNFIHFDLASGELNGYDLRLRGKTVVDGIVEILCRKTLSVIFLEHVDKADEQLQNRLSRAVQTCKFSDSLERAISIENTIFVTTLTSETEQTLFPEMRKPFYYLEDKILRTKGHALKISVEKSFEMSEILPRLNSPFTMNKRKIIGAYDESPEKNNIPEITKLAHAKAARNLDLNLPPQEIEEQEFRDADNDHAYEISMAWLQDFINQTHITQITFKPFDFGGLLEKLSNKIRENFSKIFNSYCSLDIDTKVMEQFLAAAYISDRDRAVEDWIEQVLLPEFSKVQKRYEITSHCVIRLISFDHGSVSVEQTHRNDLLPCKIFID